MRTHVATRATDTCYRLAEGPVWDDTRHELLWVDIPAGAVHVGVLEGDRVRPTAAHRVDDTVGAVARAAGDGLLVAGHRSVFHLRADGELDEVARLVPSGQRRRLNDGKCDPAGRFLVGTLSLGDEVGESLFRIEPSGAVTTVDDDLQLSNGLGWSPAGDTMYSVDTAPGTVWSRPYDPATGGHGPRTELITIADGSPDGLTVDAEGHLWIAVWGAGQVRRFTPAGEQVAVVEVAAPYASCPTFAGPDLDVLVVTTAIDDLSAEQRAAHPHSGALFVADVGVRGLPAVPWAGPPARPQSERKRS